MAPIDIDTMVALRKRLDGLAVQIEQEYNTDIPAERISAAGDSDLLAQLNRRLNDLQTAKSLHDKAVAVFGAAKAAFKVNPTTLEVKYAETCSLAAQIEAILDCRQQPVVVDEPTSDPDTATDEDDTSETGDEPAAPTPSEPEQDPVLAAIAELTRSCDGNHQAAMDAITALRDNVTPGLLRPDLAAVINGLSEETLRGVLDLVGLTPQDTKILDVLGTYGPDELARLLAELDVRVNGSPLERFRRALPKLPARPTRGSRR